MGETDKIEDRIVKEEISNAISALQKLEKAVMYISRQLVEKVIILMICRHYLILLMVIILIIQEMIFHLRLLDGDYILKGDAYVL